MVWGGHSKAEGCKCRSPELGPANPVRKQPEGPGGCGVREQGGMRCEKRPASRRALKAKLRSLGGILSVAEGPEQRPVFKMDCKGKTGRQ